MKHSIVKLFTSLLLFFCFALSPAHGMLSNRNTSTGGVVNTGSTTIRSGGDSEGSSVIDLEAKDNHPGLPVDNDGSVTLDGSLKDMNFGEVIAAIGDATRTLKVKTAQTISTSLTVPANVCVEVEEGGFFTVASGQTVTFNCFVAPSRAVFSGSGSVAFGASSAIGPNGAANAAWWIGDFGQTVALAIAALPAMGGIVDARTLTVAPSLSSNLTLSKSNTKILLGNMTLSMGSNQIIIPARTTSVAIIGQGPLGSITAQTAQGTYLSYTGTDYAIKVGGSTAFTEKVLIEDLSIHTTNVAGGGIKLTNGLYNHFHRLDINTPLPSSSAIGVLMEGTGGIGAEGYELYTAFTNIDNCTIRDFHNGVRFGGRADLCNSNWINGGAILGPNHSAGSIGAWMNAGVSNWIFGTYISGFATGLQVDAGVRWNGANGITFESNTTNVSTNASSSFNSFTYSAVNGGTDSGAGTMNSLIDMNNLAIGKDSSGTQTVIRSSGIMNLNAGGGSVIILNSNGDIDIDPSLGSLRLNRSSSAGNTDFYDGNLHRLASYTRSNTFVPESDGMGSIGTKSKRWGLIRGVTVTSGDLVLTDKESGKELYRITESEAEGISFHDVHGKLLMRIDAQGNLHVEGRVITGRKTVRRRGRGRH
jgi:hypothetical protein